MRAFTPLFLSSVLALAACGQKEESKVTVKDKDGTVTISANGDKSNVSVDANGGQVTVRAGDGKSVAEINTNGVNVSGKLPDFISVFPGARVVSLISANNQSGTLTLQSSAEPSQVLGFYKQKAEAAGFKQNLDANDAGNLLYSASFAGRTIQVLASKDSDGTHAQVTWSSS
ncbi:MAG: hypothetical protein JO056_14185 [Alphaproteobacteria bacterium]|nr:hypothetical protein [Alphaproteobacteria bacterium]